MKKIAIAVLSAVCVFALAGCADDVTMDNEQNDIVAVSYTHLTLPTNSLV